MKKKKKIKNLEKRVETLENQIIVLEDLILDIYKAEKAMFSLR